MVFGTPSHAHATALLLSSKRALDPSSTLQSVPQLEIYWQPNYADYMALTGPLGENKPSIGSAAVFSRNFFVHNIL